jgi:hypothetical protein
MHHVIRRRFPAPLLLAVLFAAVAASPFPSIAEEAPPVLRRDVGAYALFGRTYVRWNGAASMPRRGSIGSLASVELTNETMAGGEESYVAAPSVVARDGSWLHFVYTGSFVADPDVTVAHAPAPLQGELVAAVDYPRAPAVTCNADHIDVESDTSPLTLPPGRYGNVTVAADQTLRLVAGGRYELCSLRLRAGATVEANAGTFVRLRDYLVTAGRARITGDGACGARWIALAETPSLTPSGAAFEFDHGGPNARARIEGTFFTPGRILMAQHNDYVGRFWGERIDGRVADQITRTVSDCRTSFCGDGVLDAGEDCDDGNNREGDCCSAFCEVAAEGSVCEDGLFCTTTDRCNADGTCVGTTDPCERPDGDGNCSESCNEATDACNGPDPDASACEDGIWCNGADLCASGLCVAHAGSPCPGPDDDADCRESCSEATRTCNAPDAAGAACNDGRFCTSIDTCSASGTCEGAFSPCAGEDFDADCAETCDELADSCNAFDPDGAACDDGLFCTASDRCDGRGGCRGAGDPCLAFVGDDDADCTESCDEAADSCTAPDLDGAPCTDGLACSLAERCLAGSCASTGVTSCDDGNPCTDEFCGEEGSCVRSYNRAPCDDGNACTTDDHCMSGECGATERVDCRDDDLCTADECDPSDGTCHHSYAPATTCRVIGRSMTRLDLGFSPADGAPSERLMTSWRSEDPDDYTWQDDLGDLDAGDAISVCFYDESLDLPELAYRLDFDEEALAGARWKRTWRGEDLIFKLRTEDGTAHGVSSVRVGGSKRGSPTFRLRAGAGGGCSRECRDRFEAPRVRDDGRIFAMEPGMTVQWVAESGACWSARYEEASSNDQQGFRARARAD